VNREKGKGTILRPYLGRINGKIKWGKRIKLAAFDAPLSEIWQAYEEIEQPKAHTISWLLSLYLSSPHYLSLAQRTRDDYQRYAVTLRSRRMPNGESLGDCSLSRVTKRTIRGYLDTANAPIQANRQIAFLKSAWGWAEERYPIGSNPCLGVKPNPEKPRDRYVTHEDYELALSYAPEWLQIAMGLAYYCRARRAEVLALTYDKVTDDGVLVERSKRSLDEITVAQEVLDLVERSKMLSEGSDHLVRNAKGQPISTGGFDSAWRRLAKKMGDRHFQFHDLKAKGVSDMEGEQWAGHRSRKALAVYQRKARRISPVYR
jgi:integrase